MTNQYQVIARGDNFYVESASEFFPPFASREAAEMCCEQLNRWPSDRACEVVPNGRWTPRKENCDA